MGSIYKRKSRKGKGARNYSISFLDHLGRRDVRSAGTSDKRAAERILATREAEIALIKSGAVDPTQDRYQEEADKSLRAHLKDYLDACVDKQAEHGLKQKRRHLNWLLSATGAQRFNELFPDVVDARLSLLSANGTAARTINLKIECANAFLNWCVKNGRLRDNPLRLVPRRNEVLGRVRERRSLSRDECTRLLGVARDQARLTTSARLRPLWYLFALRAGLRRGDLERLTWGAIDLDSRVLTIRGGKAKKRIDRLPLSRDLVSELERVWSSKALPTMRVFSRPVSNSTRQKDFERAGICLVNSRGEHADLHSLRVTFGTELALLGVPPAVHQKLMRHSTIELTMRYYTKLNVSDLDQYGISKLPLVEAPGTGLAQRRQLL